MRSLALLVLLLLAPAVAAQSHFASGAGPYVTLDALDPLRLGDGALEIGGAAGWRFSNGLDAGLRFGAEHTTFDDPDRTVSEARRLAVGVEAGYTGWIGERTGLRFGVGGGFQQTLEVGAPTYLRDGGAVLVVDRGNQDVNAGGVRLSTSLVRRISVARIALQPSAGVFLGGDVVSRADAERPFTLRADSGRGGAAEGSAGIALSLPVLFEAAGTDLAVDLRTAYDVVRAAPDVNLRLRANF